MTIWNDWLGYQKTPVRLLRIGSVAELEQRLRQWPDLKQERLKVASSGHSTSAVGRPEPNKLLVRLEDAPWPSNQRAGWLPANVPGRNTVPYWVPACRTIRAINAELAAKGLAMPNLGSYDGQTIYGAIATGTHGMAISIGPLADAVLAIDITCVLDDGAGHPKVQSYRIERDQGITIRAAFDGDNHGSPILLNDSKAFYAAVVSLGLFGVVTGVVIEAVPEFWLEEHRRVVAWSDLKAEAGFDPLAGGRVDLVVTPLPVHHDIVVGKNEHHVLVSRKVQCPVGQNPPSRDDDRTRKARGKWEKHGHDRMAAALALSHMGSANPKFANLFAYEALVGDAKSPPWRSRSDMVMFTSIGDYVAATSCEVAFPAEKWKDAIDALIVMLKRLDDDGYHLLSPLGVRFAASTDHLLSPLHGRRSCTIEIPTLPGAHRRGGADDEQSSLADIRHVLSVLEDVLVRDFDGRPHWGQRSFFDPTTVVARYGANVAAWKEQRKRFDPFRLFDSEFSRTYAL